jgi:hypothetical protein
LLQSKVFNYSLILAYFGRLVGLMLTLRFLAPGFLQFVRGATTVDFGIVKSINKRNNVELATT